MPRSSDPAFPVIPLATQPGLSRRDLFTLAAMHRLMGELDVSDLAGMHNVADAAAQMADIQLARLDGTAQPFAIHDADDPHVAAEMP